MPKKAYHNRLEKLEEELQELLLLQAASCACIEETTTTTVTREQGMDMEQEQEQEQEQELESHWPGGYPDPRQQPAYADPRQQPGGYADPRQQPTSADMEEDHDPMCPYSEQCAANNTSRIPPEQQDRDIAEPYLYPERCAVYKRCRDSIEPFPEPEQEPEPAPQHSYHEEVPTYNGRRSFDAPMPATNQECPVVPYCRSAKRRPKTQEPQPRRPSQEPLPRREPSEMEPEIEDLYIRVSKDRLPETSSERRRSSSAPADTNTKRNSGGNDKDTCLAPCRARPPPPLCPAINICKGKPSPPHALAQPEDEVQQPELVPEAPDLEVLRRDQVQSTRESGSCREDCKYRPCRDDRERRCSSNDDPLRRDVRSSRDNVGRSEYRSSRDGLERREVRPSSRDEPVSRDVRTCRADPERENACSKFDWAIEQLRLERQQYKALQNANQKLRDMLNGARATVKEAVDSRRTSLDYSRRASERQETARIETENLKRALQDMKMEKDQLEEEVRLLQEQVGLERQMSLRSQDGNEALVASQARVSELEAQLKECDQRMMAMDARIQDEVRMRREEENTLTCAIRDSEMRARDAEARVDDLEKRLAATERRAEETERKRRMTDQDLRSKETLLEQESLKRKSIDETAKAETKRCMDKMTKMAERLRELETQRDELQEKLRQADVEVANKCAEQDADFKAFREACQEKEQQLVAERLEMVRVVQELTAVAKEHKNRVDELTEVVQQQEEVIASQKQAIANKDEQVRLANEEVSAVRKKSTDLDLQVRHLRSSVEHLERSTAQDNSLAEAQAMLAKAKQTLEAERDKLLIKDKIVDDQMNTIKQLKAQLQDRGEEMRQDCKQLEEQLLAEKQRCMKLKAELEECMWSKQDLETRLAEVESDPDTPGKHRPDESLSRNEHLLSQLELQVESKQKEWELQMKIMKQEWETASNAAKYATRKLDCVTKVFTDKAETNERVQRVMSAMLKEKDGFLAEAHEKIRLANAKIRQLSKSLVSRAQPPPDCDCDPASRRDWDYYDTQSRRGSRSRRQQRPVPPDNAAQAPWVGVDKQNYFQGVRNHPYL